MVEYQETDDPTVVRLRKSVCGITPGLVASETLVDALRHGGYTPDTLSGGGLPSAGFGVTDEPKPAVTNETATHDNTYAPGDTITLTGANQGSEATCTIAVRPVAGFGEPDVQPVATALHPAHVSAIERQVARVGTMARQMADRQLQDLGNAVQSKAVIHAKPLPPKAMR